jgi:hypothetical protein
MKRALLCCGGILLGLVADALLWAGYIPLSWAFWTGEWMPILVGLGLIVQGTVAAAGAALCLTWAFVPPHPAPAQNGISLSSGLTTAVRRRPLLPIFCGILFFLGAVELFWQAIDCYEDMRRFLDARSSVAFEEFRVRGQLALALGVLYSVLGGALLVAPLLLKPRGWPLGEGINGAGCGMAAIGLALTSVLIPVYFLYSMSHLFGRDDFWPVFSFGVLGGTVLAVVGSILAIAVGKVS